MGGFVHAVKICLRYYKFLLLVILLRHGDDDQRISIISQGHLSLDFIDVYPLLVALPSPSTQYLWTLVALHIVC